jgi:hypothetical protein
MLKFSVGDHVRITANKNFHGFEIGEEVVITKVVDDSYYNGRGVGGKGTVWAFEDHECEAVEKKEEKEKSTMKIKRDCIYYVTKKEDIPSFLKAAEEDGVIFNSGDKPTNLAGERFYGDETAFMVDISGRMMYGLFDFYKSETRYSKMGYEEWNPKKSTPEPSKPTIIHLNGVKIVFNGDYTIVTDGVRTGKAKKHEDDEYNAIEGLRVAVARFEGVECFPEKKREVKVGDNVRVIARKEDSVFGRHCISVGNICEVTDIDFERGGKVGIKVRDLITGHYQFLMEDEYELI